MSAANHQKFAGALLCVFAILELCLLAYIFEEVLELHDDMAGSGGIENVFMGLLSSALILTLGMFLVQLIGGYLLIKDSNKKKWVWGIAAGVIAISTLWAAPVGIYTIWTRLQVEKSEDITNGK